MTFGRGLTQMSENLHIFIREHVVRGWWKGRPRPVLVNSWESFYFRFTQKDLLRLARQGCGIYRTDLHGTIHLTWNQEDSYG